MRGLRHDRGQLVNAALALAMLWGTAATGVVFNQIEDD